MPIQKLDFDEATALRLSERIINVCQLVGERRSRAVVGVSRA